MRSDGEWYGGKEGLLKPALEGGERERERGAEERHEREVRREKGHLVYSG